MKTATTVKPKAKGSSPGTSIALTGARGGKVAKRGSRSAGSGIQGKRIAAKDPPGGLSDNQWRERLDELQKTLGIPDPMAGWTPRPEILPDPPAGWTPPLQILPDTQAVAVSGGVKIAGEKDDFEVIIAELFAGPPYERPQANTPYALAANAYAGRLFSSPPAEDGAGEGEDGRDDDDDAGPPRAVAVRGADPAAAAAPTAPRLIDPAVYEQADFSDGLGPPEGIESKPYVDVLEAWTARHPATPARAAGPAPVGGATAPGAVPTGAAAVPVARAWPPTDVDLAAVFLDMHRARRVAAGVVDPLPAPLEGTEMPGSRSRAMPKGEGVRAPRRGLGVTAVWAELGRVNDG